MTKVDQFESAFRSADKPVFRYEPPRVDRVLLVTDLPESEAEALLARLRAFLAVLGEGSDWKATSGDACRTIDGLLETVRAHEPDLVCTYRNLYTEAWRWPHSLGVHIEVVTQVLPYPVCVIPHPKAGRESEHALENTDVVMAMTTALAGDASLVSHAIRFTQPGGTLWLTHVEDLIDFDRYMDVISKIPTIDTDSARETILAQLLKEPHDYIASCRHEIEEKGLPVKVEELVTEGHRLSEYRRLIEDHKADLLVLPTRHEEHVAMHGLVYPLAVELRNIPLLLI